MGERESSVKFQSRPRFGALSRWHRRSPISILVLTKQQLLESLTKDLIEDGVKYRVHHRTGVAEPGDEVEDRVVDLALAVGTHGRH